jgi:hypothetical protein
MHIKRQPVTYAAVVLGTLLLLLRRHRQRQGPDDALPSTDAAGPRLASSAGSTASSTAYLASRGLESLEIGLEVPDTDAIEQNQTVVPEAGDDNDLTGVPWEVPEADLLDQHRDVILDDELRADDMTQ